MEDCGEKFVITRNGKICNCGLFESFTEAYEYIKDSIFRDCIESFTIVTFRQYVDEVEF